MKAPLIINGSCVERHIKDCCIHDSNSPIDRCLIEMGYTDVRGQGYDLYLIGGCFYILMPDTLNILLRYMWFKQEGEFNTLLEHIRSFDFTLVREDHYRLITNRGGVLIQL